MLTGHVLWQRRDRHARRRLARDRRARADDLRAGAVEHWLEPRQRAHRRAVDAQRARSCGRATCRPARSPRRSSGTRRCTSATRAAPSTRFDAATGAVNWTYHAQRGGQGRARLRRRQAVLRRLRRPRLLPQRDHRTPGVGGEHERHRVRVRLGELLRDAGGRVRARVHGQHRRARVLVRRRQRVARVGDRHRRVRLRLGRGRTTSRGSARPSTSAPTTATSTRSTPARARSAGRTAPAARSPARRRSSTTSSTTPTSVRRRAPDSTSAPASRWSRSRTARSRPVIADDRRALSGRPTEDLRAAAGGSDAKR